MSPHLYTKSSTDILERKSRRIHPSTRSFARPHRRFPLSRVPCLSPGRRQRVPHAALARVRRLIRQRSKHLRHRRGNDARATQFQHSIVYLSTHVHPRQSRQFVQRIRRCEIDRIRRVSPRDVRTSPSTRTIDVSSRVPRARTTRRATTPRVVHASRLATIDAVVRVGRARPNVDRCLASITVVVIAFDKDHHRISSRRIASHRVAPSSSVSAHASSASASAAIDRSSASSSAARVQSRPASSRRLHPKP